MRKLLRHYRASDVRFGSNCLLQQLGIDIIRSSLLFQSARQHHRTDDCDQQQHARDFGGSLYTYASLPFEIASVLLLVAIIGSVMLARTLKQEAAADDVDPELLKQAVASEPNVTGAVVTE